MFNCHRHVRSVPNKWRYFPFLLQFITIYISGYIYNKLINITFFFKFDNCGTIKMKSVQIDMLIRQDKKYISMECMNDILSIRLDIISHILGAISQICRCSHIFNIDIIEYYYLKLWQYHQGTWFNLRVFSVSCSCLYYAVLIILLCILRYIWATCRLYVKLFNQ